MRELEEASNLRKQENKKEKRKAMSCRSGKSLATGLQESSRKLFPERRTMEKP